MDKDNIFQQMASYDFKTPVTVQTIIEDSDGDSVIELSPERNSNYKNDAVDQEKESHSSHSPEIESAFFRIDPDKLQRIDELIKSVENYCEKKLDTKSWDKTKEKSRKRKSIEKQQSTANKKKFETQIKKPDQILVQSNRDSIVTTPVSNAETCPAAETLRSKDTPLKINIQINEVEKVSSYISDLLTTVSKQLITVIEAYNLYTRVTGEANNDPWRKQDALKTYLYIKDQCFNFSYITVMNILLPEENNKLFVNSFLESTVRIANSTNNAVKFSIQQVQIFYSELLEWTKKKKNTDYLLNYHDTNILNSSSDNRYCSLRQQLSEPVKPPLNNVHSQDTSERRSTIENTSKTCLYYGGALENEDSIQPDILNRKLDQISVTPNKIQNKNSNSRKETQKTREGNINALIHSSGIVSTELKNQESREKTNQFITHSQASSYKHFNGLHSSTEISVTEQNKHQNHSQLMPNFNCQNSQFSMKHVTTSQLQNKNSIPNSVPVREGELSQFQYQQRLPPPPYEVHCNWQNEFISSFSNAVDSNENQNKQLESQIHVDTMRSISTDSGFISPLNFNTASDSEQQINTAWQDVNSTPQITHVTSLNPNASFLSEGPCHVCGKNTKKKCLGCLRYYYCDFNCQKSDWNIHMMICCSLKR